MVESNKTFYESSYKMSGLNHTEEVSVENIGWTHGVLSNGVPFEAELWVMDNELTICIIIPEIFKCDDEIEYECDVEENEVFEDERTESSILKIGTYDRGYVTDHALIIKYVEYLEEFGLITFLSNHRNGGVHLLRDREGNNIVAVMITLCTIKQAYAETPLVFKGFKNNQQRLFMYKKMHI